MVAEIPARSRQTSPYLPSALVAALTLSPSVHARRQVRVLLTSRLSYPPPALLQSLPPGAMLTDPGEKTQRTAAFAENQILAIRRLVLPASFGGSYLIPHWAARTSSGKAGGGFGGSWRCGRGADKEAERVGRSQRHGKAREGVVLERDSTPSPKLFLKQLYAIRFCWLVLFLFSLCY